MKALVTGGGGFLGSAIVRMLHARGDEVAVLCRKSYAHLAAHVTRVFRGDLRDPSAVQAACKNVDAVFHVAAIPGIWGPKKLFWETNVDGTRNVIEACRAGAVRKLVFTSSPSVVFGREELCGVDESQSYPKRYLAHYPETKAVAERMVLAANGDSLSTVALRPHLIWGPGDPHLIPRIVARARAGRLVQVGDGTNRVDITYIDNAAEAHLQACDALHARADCTGHACRLGRACCAGRAYFISQGEPVVLWRWIDEVLAGVGAPRVTRFVGFRSAYRISAALEIAYRLSGVKNEPLMTRFLVMQLSHSHYFDIAAARKDFGYCPRISTTEGMRRLFESFRQSDESGEEESVHGI